MNHGKIKYHEALGYAAERNNDHAEAHRNFQQAEYYKREKTTSHVLHRGTRREAKNTLGNGHEGRRHSKGNRPEHIVSENESAADRVQPETGRE